MPIPHPAGARPSRLLPIGLAVLLALIVAACSQNPESPSLLPSSLPSPSGSSAPMETEGPSPTPAPTPPPTPTYTNPPDAELQALIPAEVGGATVTIPP
ncbi:MAG TPA: hypothetical protein VHK28_07725, partial [Candidatus Limnocylindria bacterium]|nr:hypothetical protein [Candidatus Limnocylindria bacterium]